MEKETVRREKIGNNEPIARANQEKSENGGQTQGKAPQKPNIEPIARCNQQLSENAGKTPGYNAG